MSDKLIAGKVPDRKPVKDSDKKKCIKRCNSTCMCCGKKLKPHECTVDHIWPRSKGGAYTIGNYLLLCKHCNGLKADDIYPPNAFYRELYRGNYKELRHNVQKYFVDKFDQIYKDFPYKENPLIAPQSLFLYREPIPINRGKKPKDALHTLTIDLIRITPDNKAEIEKQTHQSLENIINDSHQLAFCDRTRKDPVAIYAVRSTDITKNILMLLSIVIDDDHRKAMIYYPYVNTISDKAAVITSYIADLLATNLSRYLHHRIDQFLMFSTTDNNNIFSVFLDKDNDLCADDLFKTAIPCAAIQYEEGYAPGICNYNRNKNKRKHQDKQDAKMCMVTLRMMFTDEKLVDDPTDVYIRTNLTKKQFLEKAKRDPKNYLQKTIDCFLYNNNEHRKIILEGQINAKKKKTKKKKSQ